MTATRAFNLDDARTMAKACVLAALGGVGQTSGKLKVNEFDPLGNVCALELGDPWFGEMVLAFPGSRDAQDYADDVDALLVEDSEFGGKIHAGFRRHFGLVREFVERLAYRAARTNRRVWLTGHSLGGAMATLASVILPQQGVELAAVYTFGCPRVGNPLFARMYKPVHWRVIDDIDLVPHVPFGWWWRHIGAAVTLKGKQITVGASWWQNAAELIGRLPQGLLSEAGEGLTEHSIHQYVAALDRVELDEDLAAAA